MNQIKNFAVLFIIGIVISSCGQKPDLTAEIENIGNDTILTFCYPISKMDEMDEKQFKDTIIATNGRFTYNIPYNEPCLTYFFPKSAEVLRASGHPYWADQKIILTLLKPMDKINIEGILHRYYLSYSAQGSEFNEQYSRVRNNYINQTAEAARIEMQIDSLNNIKGDKELINQLFKKRNKIKWIGGKQEYQYAVNNLDTDLSAYFLTQQSLDTLGKYYDSLSSDVQEGVFKTMLNHEYVQYKKYNRVKVAEKKIIEGAAAPNFVLTSLNGAELSLDSINKKFVILDFWGSWCGWCFKGFPKMNEYYKKYKNDIEIIGIACNDKEDKWRNAVKENNLEWLNVINSEEIENDVSVMYGIQAYPTKFILDKNKIIVGKFVGETNEFYEKLNELIKK